MKTNQMMLRKMVDLEVFQRTDNGLYNLTGLVEQYNNTFPDNKKQLTDFLRLKSTKELEEKIEKKFSENSRKRCKSSNYEHILLKTVKTRTKGRPKHTVYGNEYLFFELALWLNVDYRIEAYDMLLNDPIFERNAIGDAYKQFSVCCNQIGCKTPDDYKVMARCLNCAVLGVNRQSEQRNSMTKEECIKIGQLQNSFITAVENGWITTIDQAKTFFRNEYNKNFKQIPF